MIPTNRTERPGRRWPWIALALLLLVAASVGMLYLRGYVAQNELKRRLDALRERGMPTDLAEYLDWREHVPPEENMAFIVLDACDQLRLAEGEWPDLWLYPSGPALELGVRWSPQRLDIVPQRLAVRREALELARQVAELEEGWYPLPPTEMAYFTWMDHLDSLGPLADLLRQSALVHAQQGRMPEAAADLAAALRIAASLGSYPTYIESLVGVGLDAGAVLALERALAVGEMGREELAMLAEELTREEARLARVDALPGARAMALQTLLRAKTAWLATYCEESRSGARWRCRIEARMPGARSRAALALLDLFKQVEKAYRLPLPQRVAAMKQAAAEWNRDPGEGSFGHSLALYFLPPMGRCARNQARGQAWVRVARTALAVEQWRLENGAWPESLQGLVPDLMESVPQDSFTGEPLRYRRTDGGVRVYSLGPDREDQGGSKWASGWRGPGEDLPFRLLDPDRRGARGMTFREELAKAGSVRLEALEHYGYGEEELKKLGLSESEIRQLASR